MKKYLQNLFAGICFLLLSLGTSVCAKEASILPGVMIDQVDVSDMTKAEAIKALEDYETKVGEQTLSIQIGEQILEANISQFGLQWDNEEVIEDAFGIGRRGNIVKRYKDQKDLKNGGKVYELDWVANSTLIRNFVENQCTQFDQPAQNASLKRANGAFEFVPGEEGLAVNVDSSVAILVDYLENDWKAGEKNASVALQVEVTKPEGSAEQLAHIKDLLGSYTTSYSTSGASRSKNVSTGAAHINGTVLYPGEEFSTYEVVSPFTEANGYGMAGSYLNGTVVDSMGGGICQVSTTLYNAVLRAELEVTERFAHSMTVSYVKLSEDAAIAGTYKDLKFKNNLDYPIYIEGYTTSDKKVTFNIYGKETRDSNRSISFESVKVSETPSKTVLREDAGQPLGYRAVSSKGGSAYVAELYKIVKVNGVETDRIKINKSSYRSSGNRVITYGTAGDPVLSENLRAAIALQDEALANANIAGIAPAQ